MVINRTSKAYNFLPKKVRVWGKGQFTIPAGIRESLKIRGNTVLNVYQIGGALVAIPEKSLVKELAAEMSSPAEKKIALAELLTELREGSHEYEAD